MNVLPCLKILGFFIPFSIFVQRFSEKSNSRYLSEAVNVIMSKSRFGLMVNTLTRVTDWIISRTDVFMFK